MNWFKEQREKELKTTQRAVALALDMTTSAVSAWENDEAAPRIGLADKLAAVYGVKPDEMVKQIVILSKRVAIAAGRGREAASPKKKLVGAK